MTLENCFQHDQSFCDKSYFIFLGARKISGYWEGHPTGIYLQLDL